MSKKPDYRHEEYFQALGVKINATRGLEPAISKFKRLVKISRVLEDYKDNQEYEKPSDKRRRKHGRAVRRNRIGETTDASTR